MTGTQEISQNNEILNGLSIFELNNAEIVAVPIACLNK